MNIHYQYAILEKYSGATGEPMSKGGGSTGLEAEPMSKGDSTVSGSPEMTTRPAILDVTEPIREEPTLAASEPILAPETVSTIGDNTTQTPQGQTVINIFGAGTSTTTSSGGISVDAETGEVITEATDPNAGSGGGGFGGGGISGGSGSKGKPMKIVKTLIPLLAIAAGITIIVLKPLK